MLRECYSAVDGCSSGSVSSSLLLSSVLLEGEQERRRKMEEIGEFSVSGFDVDLSDDGKCDCVGVNCCAF